MYVKFAIEIEDSGVGISDENLKNIFVDFMKLQEHSKINPTGTGLGLSICKLIVNKMRGDIKVASKKGVGTTFSVFICAKARMKEEPKFLRRYTIHKNEQLNIQPSMKKPGGYVKLSNKNLGDFSSIKEVRQSNKNLNQFSSVLESLKDESEVYSSERDDSFG